MRNSKRADISRPFSNIFLPPIKFEYSNKRAYIWTPQNISIINFVEAQLVQTATVFSATSKIAILLKSPLIRCSTLLIFEYAAVLNRWWVFFFNFAEEISFYEWNVWVFVWKITGVVFLLWRGVGNAFMRNWIFLVLDSGSVFLVCQNNTVE